jgi:uncharacterized protein (TIRG00374 family)
LILGYLLPALGLLWVFYNIHAKRLLEGVAAIMWWWVAAAVVCDILSYLCQGLRWQMLLRSTGEVSWGRATQAIYAGLFASELLPLRGGELVRAYLVSRWMDAGLASVLPSIVVERIFDGVCLLTAFALVATFVPLPGDLLVAELTLAIVVLLAVSLLVYVRFRRPGDDLKAGIGRDPARRRFWRRITPLLDRLDLVAKTRFFYLSLSISLLMMMFQAAAFWLMTRAFNLHLNVWAGIVVFLIVRVGTVVPNAPANVGTYQFFCVVGLTLFGVEKSLAAGFSLAVFAILTVPLWVIGLLALSRSGKTLAAIRNDVTRSLIRSGRLGQAS